jgi:DNA transformation protein
VPPKPRASKNRNPLAASSGFRSFVLDQLEPLGGVVVRSMFGGVGFYCDGLFFGLIAGDVLYLKVDATTRAEYEAEGSKPFKPYPDRSGTMQYYSVPVGVLESQHELVRWARKAVAVAERAPKSKARRDHPS